MTHHGTEALRNPPTTFVLTALFFAGARRGHTLVETYNRDVRSYVLALLWVVSGAALYAWQIVHRLSDLA